MTPDEPVNSLERCLEYITRNAWQFKLLAPTDKVTVNAGMLRSFYWHLAQRIPDWVPPPEIRGGNLLLNHVDPEAAEAQRAITKAETGTEGGGK